MIRRFPLACATVCSTTVVLGFIMFSFFSSHVAAEEKTPADQCEHHEPTWSKTEIATWKTLCRSGVVTLPEVVAGNAGDFASIELSSSFVRTILTRAPYRNLMEGQGIWIRGAHFREPLDLSDLSVDASLRISTGTFDKVVDLSRSRFAQNVSFVGSSLEGGLQMDGVRLEGSLYLGATDTPDFGPSAKSSKSRVGWIAAREAQIGGSLNVQDAEIDANIKLSYSRVNGSVNFVRLNAHGIDLAGTDIGGQVTVVFSTLRPRKGESQTEYELLNFYSVKTPQTVFLNGSVIEGLTRLQSAEIGGIVLLGSRLGTVLAQGMSVKGAFSIGYLEVPGGGLPTTWKDESFLDLRYASLGVVSGPHVPRYWPRNINFTFFSVRALASEWYAPGETPLPSATWFPAWLGREQQVFSSQPYSMLMNVLHSAGDDPAVAAVGYAKRDRELSLALKRLDGLRVAYLLFSKLTIGYGYQMWLPFVWMAFFVGLGAYIFRNSGEPEIEQIPQRVAYSFDMFIPLVRLRDLHYQIDLRGPKRTYLYFHKLAGWIIGSFILAGLAGFTN